MRITTVIAPAARPLDVREARAHVRQELAIDDQDLDSFIRGARDFAESACNCTIVATRYLATLDGFSSCIGLERGPILRVRSVKYLDLAGVWQTVAPTDYVADLTGPVPRLVPAWGKTWPADAMPQIASVRIEYDAGYAAALTADAAADTLTIKGGVWAPLAVNDPVRLSNSGGTLPAPLQEDADYYVQSLPTATSFKLSLSVDGAAIELADAGSGTHYIGLVPDGLKDWIKLRVGALYENREESVQGQSFQTLPYVDAMLDQYRVEFA